MSETNVRSWPFTPEGISHPAGLTALHGRDKNGSVTVETTAVASVQLTFDDLVTMAAAVNELRTAAETARAARRLRYADELEHLADQLFAVTMKHTRATHHPRNRSRRSRS